MAILSVWLLLAGADAARAESGVNRTAREDGQRYQTLANVSIALTGVAAATAVTLFFLEPGAGGEQLALGVAPGAAVVSGRF